jgi:hypothetical protein
MASGALVVMIVVFMLIIVARPERRAHSGSCAQFGIAQFRVDAAYNSNAIGFQ